MCIFGAWMPYITKIVAAARGCSRSRSIGKASYFLTLVFLSLHQILIFISSVNSILWIVELSLSSYYTALNLLKSTRRKRLARTWPDDEVKALKKD